MPIHRRRYRIEQAVTSGAPMADFAEADVGPMHREIMTELRAIRAQMAGSGYVPNPGPNAAMAALDASAAREVAEARALLETYRAQIEQCEKLKIELDLIHDAIDRTKREIAVLHGKSFNGEEMAKVNGELGAVVGGTEEATQQILEAAEAIDQSAAAIASVTSPDQQKILSEEIQDKVIAIFEACNFQDLQMMDIWGGVDEIKSHAPAILDTREGDAKLLNGPKADGDAGHASQDDIDALFD